MPKRGAEKQLSKDDMDQEEDEIEETSGEGFRKADEAVLATRKIKGLPKRGGSSSFSSTTSMSSVSTIANSEASEPTTPKFGGFGGFGASSSSSTPFSFTAPTPPAVPSTFSAAPPVSSKASNATKAFASLLGPPAASSSPASDAPKASSIGEAKDDDSEYKYYLALRGINVSLLTALSKAVDSDPFADISNMLESYKSLRIKAQSDYDSQSKSGSGSGSSSTSMAAPANPFAAASPSTSSNSTPAPAPSFSMPKPPTSFTGFSAGSAFPAPDTSKPASGLFASFAPPKATPVEAPAPPASSSPVLPAPKPSTLFPGFSGFGAPAPASTTASSSTTTSFGGTGLSPSLFGGGSTTADSSKPPEEFKSEEVAPASGFSIFGSGPASRKPSTGPSFFAMPPPESSTTTTNSNTVASPFKFGGSSSSTTTMKSGFSFGDTSSGAPKKTELFGGFGSTKTGSSGSLGNPVGFGFGGGSSTTTKPGGLAAGSSGFSFSSSSSSTSPFGSQSSNKENTEEAENTTEGGDGQSQSQSEADAATPTTGTPNHDEEGEGEEDEETTFAVKSKCHVLGDKKTEDGKTTSGWSELGVGILRLKKHKDSESRRILMRNSSSGRIILNFSLFKTFSVKLQGKGVMTFIGHDSEGQAKSYRIRVATEAKAKELQEAIDKEVASLVTKDS